MMLAIDASDNICPFVAYQLSTLEAPWMAKMRLTVDDTCSMIIFYRGQYYTGYSV
jgi:hypothetical protein